MINFGPTLKEKIQRACGRRNCVGCERALDQEGPTCKYCDLDVGDGRWRSLVRALIVRLEPFFKQPSEDDEVNAWILSALDTELAQKAPPEPECPCVRCGRDDANHAWLDGSGDPICDTCAAIAHEAIARQVVAAQGLLRLRHRPRRRLAPRAAAKRAIILEPGALEAIAAQLQAAHDVTGGNIRSNADMQALAEGARAIRALCSTQRIPDEDPGAPRDGDGDAAVDHPPHYNTGRIEVIDFIEDKKHKDSELQDLKKARWYLDRRIEKLETEDAEESA